MRIRQFPGAIIQYLLVMHWELARSSFGVASGATLILKLDLVRRI
jgi:multisubunit Na+/H+ antiporter MnhE subunit